MSFSWSLVGNVFGGIGLVLAMVAAGARVAGQFHLAGFEAMTLFQGAVGLLVTACFFKLLAMERHR